MRLYNTMSRSIEEFVPINEGKVSMYCCGPTVYNYAHIGNLRTYIFEDLLRRTLRRSGYDVKHVMNITDVGHLTGDGDDGEDKMEKSARETGRTVWDIAEFYMKAFFRDEEALNIERPDIICRATEHIDDMINLIKRLEEGGHTYISGGNVYFSIDSISDYGKLARLNLDDLKSGARIEVDSNKKNPKDFVLWFTNSKFKDQAMMWDSPWGRGYPGWHIECSAMSMKYLGEHFDIHCGGIDAIPVHHTNEIAQSEAATGKTWVNYWCHGEFLLMGNAKMSKSSGSFVTLPVLEGEGYDALDYRYFCLTGHYRSQLRFSYEALDAARSARKGIMERIADAKSEGPAATDPSEKAREYMAAFDEAMENDLNAPKALSILWQMLKDNGLSSSDKLAAAYHMDGILGLGLDKAEKKEETLDAELQALLDERTAAKKAKDYKKADEIRDKLLSMGYAVKDTPAGPVLQKM
ncbi:MAG: cysteine--tRNA ligase [Spirochaetes bacterium]|uniref:Cysteine--tRNA ligase n=1 Tax=Candidatus Ornithospirochaeta stercoravium TaxID=2840897 RepID=A0A9D9NDE6_9SPIO|nr:cysteine--tRNA ligase [Candidatus Ornithospirochaeta stercoravium]